MIKSIGMKEMMLHEVNFEQNMECEGQYFNIKLERFAGANGTRPGILGLDVPHLVSGKQKDIKGFENKIPVYRTDQHRLEERRSTGRCCNKIIKAEIQAEVGIEELFMRHYKFDRICQPNTRKLLCALKVGSLRGTELCWEEEKRWQLVIYNSMRISNRQMKMQPWKLGEVRE